MGAATGTASSVGAERLGHRQVSRGFATLVAVALLGPSAIGCARRPSRAAERTHVAVAPVTFRVPTTAARHVPERCQAIVHAIRPVDARDGSTGTAPAAASSALPAEALSADSPERRVVLEALILGAVDPARDVSEVLVCFAVSENDVRTVVVASGSLPGDALVPTVLATSPGAVRLPLGGFDAVTFYVDDRRWYAAQAADGSVVFGDDAPLVASALPISFRGVDVPIPFDAPLAIYAEGAAVARAMKAEGAPRALMVALADARSMTLVAGSSASLRLSYPSPARAAEVADPVREIVDRRLDEASRVVARAEGNDVVVDVDSMRFLRGVAW